MERSRRRRIIIAATVLAAIGAIGWAALKILPGVALTSAVLDDLMDACAQVVAEDDTAALPGPWLWPLGSGDRGARVATKDGWLWVIVQTDYRDGSIHACSIRGDIRGRDATIRNPDVSWSEAMPQIKAWFDRRVLQPGNVLLVDGFAGPEKAFIASCPGPGEGFFLKAGPGGYGSISSGIPDADRPMSFAASHSSDPAQACEFVAEGGAGG